MGGLIPELEFNKMRKNIVVGNWKMNLDREEAFDLISKVLLNLPKNNFPEIVFAPSNIYLDKLSKICTNINNVSVASQDCSANERGAFTGEVSASMIASCNVDYVILGHSERRINFNESNSLLRTKLNRVLENQLRVIFCCGESLEKRNKEVHLDWIRSQISESLFHLSATDFSKIVIAYEPIWAIGTGVTASAEQAQRTHLFIRNIIADRYGSSVADSTSILYGGSCNPSNSFSLFSQEDIDGGLIGGSSLKSLDFISIINSFNK